MSLHVANFSLGINIAFTWGWWEPSVGYAAYLAYQRNAVIDWSKAIGLPNGSSLPKIHLDMIFADHKEDIGRGMRNALDLWQGTHDFTEKAADADYPGFEQEIGPSNAIIGTAWSDITKPVAAAGNALNTVQIGYASTSPELSDKEKYPFFTRVCPSEDAFWYAAKRLLISLNYTRTTFFYSAAEWGNDLFKSTSILNQVSLGQLDISAYSLPYVSNQQVTSVPPSMKSVWHATMSRAMQTGNRVNVFFASSWDREYEKVLRFAHELGFSGSQYLWIAVTDNVLFERFRNQTLFPPAHGRTIQESFSGMIYIKPNKEGPRDAELNAFYGSLNSDDFIDPVRKHLIAEGQWHFSSGTAFDMPRLFDAVCLFLIASIRLLRRGFAAHEIKSTVLLDELYKIRFPGAASMVELNSNGDVKSMFSVYNYQKMQSDDPMQWHFVRVADGSDAKLVWLRPVIYPGGGSTPPTEAFICPPGSSWSDSASHGQIIGCIECKKGESGLGGILPCLQCANGTFSQIEGATSCLLAQPGSFVSGEGKSAEVACPQGQYSTDAGRSNCDTCTKGRYAAAGGSTHCEQCEAGTFGNLSGTTVCYSCPPMKTTRWVGAVSESDCACVAGMFWNRAILQCEPCVEGIVCDSVRDDVPLILPGYSADTVLNQDSFGGHTIYKCSSIRSCPGGVAGTCPENSGGPACADCYGETFWNGSHCAACSLSGSVQFLGVILLISGLWIACIIAYIVCNSMAVSDVAFALNFSISLGLMVNVTMSFSVFSRFSLDWQEPIASIINFFSGLSMPLAFGEIQCFFNGNPTQSYIFTSLLPWIAALLIFFGYVMKCPSYKLHNTAGLCAYGCFTLLMLNGIKPFVLYQHPNDESSMVTHPGVLLGSPVHMQLSLVAILQLLVYCFGYITLCCHACVRLGRLQRQGITDQTVQQISTLLKWYGFLFIRFKPSHFYWGTVFLIRSALISLVPIIRPEEPYMQVLTLLMILTGFFILHCVNLPFREPVENAADAATQAVLIIFIASGTLFLPKTGLSVKVLCFGLSVALLGVIIVLATILFMPCIRLLKTGLKRKSSQDEALGKRFEEADILNELLGNQCGACVTLPLPSSLVPMENFGTLETARAQFHIVGEDAARPGEDVSAQVELRDTSLCIRFNSYAVAWKAQYVQEALRKESQLFDMMRCLMAAILDGVLTLRSLEDTEEFVVKWCDPKLEDLLTCPVHSAHSNNLIGMVSRPPIAGDKILDYICDQDKRKLFGFFRSLFVCKMEESCSSMSVAMRNRGGGRFECDIFGIPSMYRGEVLLGLRVTNLLDATGEMENKANTMPLEHFADFDLKAWVLHSCSPNWNVLFRQRMDGKPFLSHLVRPEDMQRVDSAIQHFQNFRNPQHLHDLEFVQGSNVNRGTRFRAALVLSHDESKGPDILQLALAKISWVPSDRRHCVTLKTKQLRRAMTQPSLLSLVSIKEQEPLASPMQDLGNALESNSQSLDGILDDLERSQFAMTGRIREAPKKASFTRSLVKEIEVRRVKSEPTLGTRRSESSPPRSPRQSRKSAYTLPAPDAGEIFRANKVLKAIPKASSIPKREVPGLAPSEDVAATRTDSEATPPKAVQMGLLALMFHINPDARNKHRSVVSCCEWHAVLHALGEASRSLQRLEGGSCRPSWNRYTDWQCKACQSFNSAGEDSATIECGVCGEMLLAKKSKRPPRVAIEPKEKQLIMM